MVSSHPFRGAVAARVRGSVMLVVLVDDDEREIGPTVRQGSDSLEIEFEGQVTVTERDGKQHSEHACQRWTFSKDSGFLLTINFGTERKPRVTLAGTDKTPAAHIGEAVASAIRAMSSQPSTHEGPEGS